MLKCFYLVPITVDQRSGANLEKCVFCKTLLFLAFLHKNAKNDYFDQPMGCAAPKHWSKYTTAGLLFFTLSKRF